MNTLDDNQESPAKRAPIRIQRKRTKGWRMPENTVYVGRPSKWGNPFLAFGWQAALRAVLLLGERGDRAGMRRAAVKLFRLWLTAEWQEVTEDTRDAWEREVYTVKAERLLTLAEVKAELRGKDLTCWCPLDQPCHADVLLELANK